MKDDVLGGTIPESKCPEMKLSERRPCRRPEFVGGWDHVLMPRRVLSPAGAGGAGRDAAVRDPCAT